MSIRGTVFGTRITSFKARPTVPRRLFRLLDARSYECQQYFAAPFDVLDLYRRVLVIPYLRPTVQPQATVAISQLSSSGSSSSGIKGLSSNHVNVQLDNPYNLFSGKCQSQRLRAPWLARRQNSSPFLSDIFPLTTTRAGGRSVSLFFEMFAGTRRFRYCPNSRPSSGTSSVAVFGKLCARSR